jgi:prevent-host-death family protein
MDQISVSKFKATCLAVIEQVKLTGNSIVITKRGLPIAVVNPVVTPANPSWLGSATGTAFITGDLVEPLTDLDPEAVIAGWDKQNVLNEPTKEKKRKARTE